MKGFEVLMCAVNPNPRVAEFVNRYKLPFLVGTAEDAKAREYMGFSVMRQTYVPWMVYIDKNGNIRQQHTGNDAYFYSEEKSSRVIIEKLLSERALPASKKGASKGKTAKKV